MASVYPAPPPVHHKFVVIRIPDVSTEDTVYFVPGFRGKIRKMHTALHGAISGADADVSLLISGTAVTGSTATIAQASSAAGDVDTATPTAANTFTPTDTVEVFTDGASTGTVSVDVTLELEPV